MAGSWGTMDRVASSAHRKMLTALEVTVNFISIGRGSLWEVFYKQGNHMI